MARMPDQPVTPTTDKPPPRCQCCGNVLKNDTYGSFCEDCAVGFRGGGASADWTVAAGTLTVNKEDQVTPAWTGTVGTTPGAAPVTSNTTT